MVFLLESVEEIMYINISFHGSKIMLGPRQIY